MRQSLTDDQSFEVLTNGQPSSLEQAFTNLWQNLGPVGVPLQPEHRWHPTRKWRFDFAHIDTRTAIELEGITSAGGRHQRLRGYQQDCEKYNSAALAGWLVLRFTQLDLDERPVQVIQEVCAAIVRGGYPGSTKLGR